MEEVVKKIIGIEHEAQNIVSEGKEEREKIMQATRKELDEMAANIREMSLHKIEQLKSKDRRLADDKVIRVYENTALKMRLIEEAFEENQEKWENEIFNRVLGR